jgi:hypothetical protein
VTLQQLYDKIGTMLQSSPELADSRVLYSENDWYSSAEDISADAEGDIIIRDIAVH